jgi:hypothetical protein
MNKKASKKRVDRHFSTRIVDLSGLSTDLGVPALVHVAEDLLALDADRNRRGYVGS